MTPLISLLLVVILCSAAAYLTYQGDKTDEHATMIVGSASVGIGIALIIDMLKDIL